MGCSDTNIAEEETQYVNKVGRKWSMVKGGGAWGGSETRVVNTRTTP